MANGDRQEKSLETLKLINAAYTALRLYPEASVRVMDSIENAYQGTKSFLRENELLRLSFSDGTYLLNGEPVNNQTREHLQLLTFIDQLHKMALDEMVLSKEVDRPVFKKILSVFNATPEQIQQAGGYRAFIELQELTEIFPEHYVVPGESEAEKKQKEKIDNIIRALSGGMARPEQILYLIGRKKGKNIQVSLQKNFQSTDKAARIIATTTFTLLQVLLEDHVIAVVPSFSLGLEKINSFLDENQLEEVSHRTARLLAPYLDESSVLVLICQDFTTAFGEYFYGSLLQAVESQTLINVLDWMKGQQEIAVKGSGNSPQLLAVSQGYEKLLTNPRGKQLFALETSREELKKIEYEKKEKRVQEGITALANGDLESLKNEEVCLSLPSTIEKLLSNDKESVAAAIVQNIVNGLKDRDSVHRSRLAQAIGGVAEKLAHIERWGWLEKLTPVCVAWMRKNETADQSFEQHVIAMQAMMNHAWHCNNYDLAERILNVFYHIRSGALGKSEAVRKIVGQVQDRNVDMELLQIYLDKCFVKPVDEMICRRITMQGPVAARFLLDTLITSDKRANRIRLLKILSAMGDDLVPVLLERLPDPMPWFGKRNIIRLLAETGSEKDVEAVLGYVSHDDLRVQQETVQCIGQIGGASTEKYLLQVLADVSAQTKVQVVKNLRRVADEEAIGPLSELLEECRLYSDPEKKLLAFEISRTLGATENPKAFPLLQKIIDGGGKQFGQESVNSAEMAISFIQEQGHSGKKSLGAHDHDRNVQDSLSAAETAVTGTGPLIAGYDCITAYPEEKEVYKFLLQDKKEAAKKILFQLIEKTAQFKKFNEAEALRLRLIDIDPMALAEIIKAAETIEESKSNSVDRDHILIWSDLYDLLTTEEFNAFYHALEHETYSTETAIVNQGDPQWRLFFVNKGRVKLFYHEKENETLVQTIGRGNAFGGSSFFDNSVWTLSATSMGAVELSTLSMEKVEEWGDVYPALEAKLEEYCLHFDRITDFFITSGADRRVDERRPLSAEVYMTLADGDGGASDTTIRGEGSDISKGGLSFHARITQRKNARTLLGRHVSIFFKDEEQSDKKTGISGTVVAVRNLHSVESDRSVHIRFDEDLEQSKLMDLIDGK